MAEHLVEFDADLESRDIEGWTPLHAAANCGNLKMINFLLDHGASLVAINHDDKMPIDVAADSDIRYILQQKMTEAGNVLSTIVVFVTCQSKICPQATRMMFWDTYEQALPRQCWQI